jgi:hypothetical protein
MHGEGVLSRLHPPLWQASASKLHQILGETDAQRLE